MKARFFHVVHTVLAALDHYVFRHKWEWLCGKALTVGIPGAVYKNGRLTLYVNNDDFDALVAQLANPPEPSDGLRGAMRLNKDWRN